eukprot:s24_g45.t1
MLRGWAQDVGLKASLTTRELHPGPCLVEGMATGLDGDRGTIPKHPQQLFFDNVNPATRLLEKRRQMYEVQDALENQKARFAKEEEQFRKKEEQLRVKDLHLQNQLVKFNKFLQDNEAKRRRSETRAHEEAAQIKQKDEEIQDLEKQLQDSKATCTKLEEEKDRNMKYEEIGMRHFGSRIRQRRGVTQILHLRLRPAQMQKIQVESNAEQLFRDMSATLLLEMHSIAQKLQDNFTQELRKELDELRSNLAKDRKAAQFFQGSESISKVTTEISRPVPRLMKARSFHFAPHVWATRHIRRYRQSEDEEDEELEEGERLRVKSTKSRVPSRPSTAASRPRVSFAISRGCSEQHFDHSPHPMVLLGQEPDLNDIKQQEALQVTKVAELPGVIQTDEPDALDLPAVLESLAVHKDDSQPSASGDGSQLLSPTRAAKNSSRPKTKAVSVRPADRARGNGCESIEVAMGLRAMFSENHHRHRDSGACRRWISRFVRSQKFEYLVVAVIVTHTILAGAQINGMTLTGAADPAAGFRAMDIVICIFFALEVGLRLAAHGFKFFYMLGWGWNVLDFFLVLAQILEELLILASNGHFGGMDFGVLRIVRTLRCIRLLRVLRITRFFDDLRRLVACIVYSAKSFIWSVAFVFLLVYIYGLYLTQSVHLHRLETGPNAAGDEVLAEYFGTVGRSILSLFQALTGGIDWRDLVEPLSQYMNWGWGLATVIWIAFLMLGVMNIITGNFVSAAMERSQSVKDVDNVFQARRLFKSLDIDDNGAITIDEIRRHLESKPVQQFFRTIDVDSSEAEVLFEILDLSGDGSIDKEEFISGCLRLQGAARAVDLLLMTKDTRRGFEQILCYLEELTQRFEATQDSLSRSESGRRSNSDNGLS